MPFVIFCFVLLYVGAALIMGSFTADEVNFVLSIALHHAVHIGLLAGVLLNIVFSAVAVPFDVLVALLRSVTGS